MLFHYNASISSVSSLLPVLQKPYGRPVDSVLGSLAVSSPAFQEEIANDLTVTGTSFSVGPTLGPPVPWGLIHSLLLLVSFLALHLLENVSVFRWIPFSQEGF